MKQLIKVAKTVMFVVLMSVLILGEGIPNGVKNRRGGNVGLFPFPRVGRSGPAPHAIDWQYDIGKDYPSIDYPLMKRAGLFPFPRVGRAGPLALPTYYTAWLIKGDDSPGLGNKRANNVATGGCADLSQRPGREAEDELSAIAVPRGNLGGEYVPDSNQD